MKEETVLYRVANDDERNGLLAEALGRLGEDVRLNCIAPGTLDTTP